ncbi:MAG: cytidine/deoxycytidylate deaminase family protein [Deltaproteobacteria bacterium]|jgi:dCMP deaminase|nr:cytidine/deoxycytidylate deaminase family protein [Deltaproteobacteria bacterium]
MTKKRQAWDEYFMNIARMVATRSTCPRKAVGAVIVKDHAILSTGYNGSMRGAPHCTDVGCMMENGHCVATIHAEQNAIIHAAKHGISMENSVIYVTSSPCWICFKMIVNSGITKIFYGEFYRDKKSMYWAEKLGVDMIHIKLDQIPPLENL